MAPVIDRALDIKAKIAGCIVMLPVVYFFGFLCLGIRGLVRQLLKKKDGEKKDGEKKDGPEENA